MKEYWERVKRAFGLINLGSRSTSDATTKAATVAFVNYNNILIKRHYKYLIGILIPGYISRIYWSTKLANGPFTLDFLALGFVFVSGFFHRWQHVIFVNLLIFGFLIFSSISDLAQQFETISHRSELWGEHLIEVCFSIFR